MWTSVFNVAFSRLCSKPNRSTIKEEDFYAALDFGENRSYLTPSSINV